MFYKKNPSAYTRCEKCRHIDRENEECRVANDKWLVCDDAGECRQFSQEGVSMIGKCVVMGSGLEYGKEYNLLECDNNFVATVNENGEFKKYAKYCFEIFKDEELDVDLSSKYHIPTYDEEININVEPLKNMADSGEEIIKKVAKAMSKGMTREASSVDHPNHYNKGKFEVIEVIEDWDLNFHLGNTIKYIARAKHKGRELEDLEKAMWYLNREIERVKAND